jgi:hypothetical protein
MVYKYIEIEDYNIDFILIIFQLKVEKKIQGRKLPTQGKAFALI